MKYLPSTYSLSSLQLDNALLLITEASSCGPSVPTVCPLLSLRRIIGLLRNYGFLGGAVRRAMDLPLGWGFRFGCCLPFLRGGR